MSSNTVFLQLNPSSFGKLYFCIVIFQGVYVITGQDVEFLIHKT